jgi:hypothetical protein
MENNTIQYQGKTIHQKHIVHFCLECLGEDSRCDTCNGIGEWESTVDLDFGYEPQSLNYYEIKEKDFHKYIDPTNKEVA